jgi:hypothetical protein
MRSHAARRSFPLCFLVIVWFVGTAASAQPNISISGLSQVETHSGTTDFQFTVHLSGSSAETVTVDWTTSDGTAYAPEDYLAGSGTVEFSPGSTSEPVTVSVVGERLWEQDEYFNVFLSNPVNGNISTGSAYAWIENDDVRVSIAGLSQPEGSGGTTPFVLTLTKSDVYDVPVSVDWATRNGNATAPDDYAHETGTVVFAPSETERTIEISVVGDRDYEQNQCFYVDLSNPVDCGIGTATATVWIENDDVRVSIAGLSQDEGNDGTNAFVLTLTKSDVYDVPVSVDWATRNGNASAPDDYVSTSGTVVFDPGVTERTIEVSVVGDRDWEQDEYFYVDLSNPVDCSIGTGSALTWIRNDDVRISIATVYVDEGNSGTTDTAFSLTLSAAYPYEIQVDWVTADLTAVAPEDYIAASGTAVFPPGSTDPQTATVSVVGDTDWEQDEYFQVLLSNPVNASIQHGSAYGSIHNDDVRIYIGNVSLPEGDSGTTDFIFEVTLSDPYPLPVSVDWTTQDANAVAPDDYIATSGTVHFPAEETLQTVTVQVVGDLAREVDELFTVNLSNPGNASIGSGQGLGNILNDDDFPEVSIGDASHFEGNSGTSSFDLDVTLSAAYVEEVSVFYSTAEGTAETPEDYVNTSDSVVFPVGETEGVATIPVVGDHEVEDDETFQVTIFSPVNATVGDGMAVATILNDDVAGDLFVDDLSLSEGDVGLTDFVFTVSLVEANLATIQVDYATADGTAVADEDYVPAAGTLIFDPGVVEQPVTVQVIGDMLDECFEEFLVVLSNPVNATIGDDQGIGTVLTDDLLACPDADGDCYHDEACGGRDCEDTVAATYPEAPETNDTLDNQCPGDPGYGVVDEISGVCAFPNPADATEFSWPPQSLAVSYDVARSTVADFSADCVLLLATTDPYIHDPESPGAGQVLYYLVRPLSAHLGSWGQRSSGAERLFSCP